MREIQLDKDAKLYKDGDCWIVLVGENLQDGIVYYDETKSVFGAISKYIYEETNCYEPSAVEQLVPTVIDNIVEQLSKFLSINNMENGSNFTFLRDLRNPDDFTELVEQVKKSEEKELDEYSVRVAMDWLICWLMEHLNEFKKR